jgi:hypothetical protein
MAAFYHNDEQCLHFVQVKKTLPVKEPEYKEFEKGKAGKRARHLLSSPEVTIARIELIITAPVISNPHTFHAALLVDLVRIRGVDYNPIARKRWYKERIPEGWHQNIDYPNHPKDNRHDPLDLGVITDLADFARKICSLWNIELPVKQTELF